MQTSQTGYVYHWVPADLQGHILYPLNQLQSIYPSLYVTKAAKYENREAIMQARLPLLNCLWNDVLHFSPVHPSRVQEALAAAGFGRKRLRYYEVDPLAKGFNATNDVVLLHHRLNLEKFELEEADFRVFHPAELSSLGEIPAATRTYYRKMFEQGKRPLVYLYVPHILYQGKLDISDVNIIEVL
jgi:hypothetical protein